MGNTMRQEGKLIKTNQSAFGFWLLVVALGGIFAGLTAPGQTAGLSVFTDPVIEDLGITRAEISFSYLLATLVGAAALPITGKLMDKFGTRMIIQVSGLGLAGSLLVASSAAELFSLTFSYMGLRLFGQGVLALAATTLVAKLIVKRSGLALGIASALGAALVSLAPVLLSLGVEQFGHRKTWVLVALLVLALILGLSFLIPEPKTQYTETGSISILKLSGHSRDFALRSGMFWVITASISTVVMIFTGIAFHLISILGAQGLSPFEAAANFLPQTLTGLILTVLLGSFSDKGDPRWGITFSLGTLIVALWMLPIVSPGILGLVFGLLLGASTGAMKGIEAAALVLYFGPKEIGAIRGVSSSLSIIGTGLGPIYFSLGLDLFGNYTTAASFISLIPAGVIILAWLTKNPPPVPKTA